MAASLEKALILVWKQALVEDAKTLKVENREFSIQADQPIQIAPSGFSV